MLEDESGGKLGEMQPRAIRNQLDEKKAGSQGREGFLGRRKSLLY